MLPVQLSGIGWERVVTPAFCCCAEWKDPKASPPTILAAATLNGAAFPERSDSLAVLSFPRFARVFANEPPALICKSRGCLTI